MPTANEGSDERYTAGWTCDTQHRTSETRLNLAGIPIETSRTCTTVTTWQSPSPIPLRARFVLKTWWRRLWERVRPAPSSGDPEFDRTVSIVTDDVEPLGWFLEDPEVRRSLTQHIEQGGDLRIERNQFQLRTRARHDFLEPDPVVVRDVLFAIGRVKILDRLADEDEHGPYEDVEVEPLL